MGKKLTFKAYRQLVEEQTRALLEVIAFAATGRFDVEVKVPEGIEGLTDLSVGLSYLIDDLRAMVAEHDKIRQELEERVAERTQELQDALEEMQKIQRRYVREQWQAYAAAIEEVETADALEPSIWEEALQEAVEKQKVVARVNGGQPAAVAVPLRYADELIGVLGFSAEDQAEWDEADLAAVEAIAEQVGLALENQRLFDQTQLALSESEALYSFSRELTNATTMDEIAATMAAATNAESAFIFLIQTDFTNLPEAMRLAGFWEGAAEPMLERGTRLDVAEFPSFRQWIDEPGRPHFYEDVAAVQQLKAEIQAFALRHNVAASAWLPLVASHQWVGVAVLNWANAQVFDTVAHRIYQSIMGQTAVSVSQLLLRQETEERAHLLEQLANIEVAISQARTEADLVEALGTGFFTEGHGNVQLHYLNQQVGAGQTDFHLVAAWTDGRVQDIHQPPYSAEGLNAIEPVAQALLHNPTNIIALEDVREANGLTARMQSQLAAQGVRSLAALGLKSAGQWHAIATFATPEPHDWTSAEMFIFERLLEPLAATVARQQAYLLQQAALNEIANLYEASEELTRARTYDEVLDALRHYSFLGDSPTVVNLMLYDRPWSGLTTPRWVDVLARWSQDPSVEAPTRINLTRQFPSFFEIISPTRPTLVEDVATDKRLNKELRTYYLERNRASVLFVPLVVGNRVIGLLTAAYNTTTSFVEADVRQLATLVGQGATAVQNIRLLEEATRRVQQEQVLREITEKVRSATDVDTIMRTAAKEIGRVLGRKAFVYLEDRTIEPTDAGETLTYND